MYKILVQSVFNAMILRLFLIFFVSYARAFTEVGNKSIASCVNDGLVSRITPTLATYSSTSYISAMNVCAKWSGYNSECNPDLQSKLRLLIQLDEGSILKLETEFYTKYASQNIYCHVFNESTIANKTNGRNLNNSKFGAEAIVYSEGNKTAQMERLLEIEKDADTGNLVSIKNLAKTLSRSVQGVGSVQLEQIANLIDDEKLQANMVLQREEGRDGKKGKIKKLKSLTEERRTIIRGHMFTFLLQDIKTLAETAMDLENSDLETEDTIEELGRLAAAKNVSRWTDPVLTEENINAMKALSRCQSSTLEEIKTHRAYDDNEQFKNLLDQAIIVNNERIAQTPDGYANELKEDSTEAQTARFQEMMVISGNHFGDEDRTLISRMISHERSRLQTIVMLERTKIKAVLDEYARVEGVVNSLKMIPAAKRKISKLLQIAKIVASAKDELPSFEVSVSNEPFNFACPVRVIYLDWLSFSPLKLSA